MINLRQKLREGFETLRQGASGGMSNLRNNTSNFGSLMRGVGYSVNNGIVNNTPQFKMPITQAIRQTAPSVATDFSNKFRQGFQVPEKTSQGYKLKPLTSVNRVIQPALNSTANTAQAVASGVTDIVTGGLDLVQNKGLVNKGAAALKIIRGGAKQAAAATPLYQGANILNTFQPQGFGKRLTSGFMEGMTQTQQSPETQYKNINVPILGQVDPVRFAGNAIGFTQNPMNKNLFKFTEKVLPQSASTATRWLLSNGVRGGVENTILNLPEIPQNLNDTSKAQWLAQNFGEGAMQELLGQGLLQGGSKVLDKGSRTKLGKATVKFVSKNAQDTAQFTSKQLGKVYDEVADFHRRMNVPVKTLEQDPQTGEFITRPMWQVMMKNQAGSVGGETPDILKREIKPNEVVDPRTGNVVKVPLTQKQALETGGKATVGMPKQDGMPLPNDETIAQAEANLGVESILGKKGNFFNEAQALPQELRKQFESFVNTRRSGDITSRKVMQNFTELDSKGIDGFKEIQAGSKTPTAQKIRQFFDAKRKQVVDAGIDVGYKEDYLPQLWANTPEQVSQVFQKKLGQKPQFSLERIIEDYQTGIKAGLTPRVSKVSDLVGWYEQTANKTIANKQFFDYLGQNGYIAPSTQAPQGWVTLNPEAFPKYVMGIKGQEKQYVGTYSAPPEVAKTLNNYFSQGSDVGNAVGGYFSSVKNRILTGGIPNTAINAHGLNILARNTLASKNPIGGFMQTAYYLANPKAAGKFIDQNLPQAERLVKSGLTISSPELEFKKFTPDLNDSYWQKAYKGISNKLDSWFGDPLFQKVIPAVKVQYADGLAQDLIKRGVSEEDAFKQASLAANNMFGGINVDEIGRSKDLQNLMRSIILAPDWAETNIKIGKGLLGLTNPKNFFKPEYLPYRRFATNFIGAYIAANAINKASSGMYMWQNEPGNEFNIDSGQYDSNGKKVYIRPFGTAADMIRLPFEMVSGLVKGNTNNIVKTVSNRINPVAATGIRLITNEDYMGRPLRGDTISLPKELANQGSEVLQGVVGVPNFIKSGFDYATGKTSAPEAIAQATEAPLRFYGGAYSKTQKEVSDTLKKQGVSGKELFDANKSLKGQTLSDNQKALVVQNGSGVLETIMKNRENKKLKSDQSSKIEGNAYYYLDDKGDTKKIDLNFEPEKPTLTGQKELDKKILSKYKSGITSKASDIVELYKQGQITAQQAEQAIKYYEQLKTFYTNKKGKKVSGTISYKEVVDAYIKALELPKAQTTKSTSFGDYLNTRKKSFKLKKYGTIK